MSGHAIRHSVAFALAATLIPLASTMLAVAMPGIAASLGVDAAQLTPWLVASYLAVSILGTGPGGRIADSLGAPRALAWGQVACGAGALLGTIGATLPMLVAARVLMAAGGALMVPAAMALLRAVTLPERRARAFGLFGALMGVAAGAGPLIGGELAHRFGWRATFAVLLLPLAVSAWLARGIPEVAAPSRADELPGVLRELASSRAFVGGSLVVALQNCAMYAVLFQMPLLLGVLRGESEAVVGRALLSLTAAMVVGSWLGGHVSERLGPRATVVIACGVSVAGLARLRDVASIRTALDAVPGLAPLGLGVGLTTGPSNGSAMSAVSGRRSATAAGVMSSVRYVGGVLGMLALLPLKSRVSPELAESLHAHALALLLGASVLAAFAGLLLPGRAPRAGSPAGASSPAPR